MVVQLIGLVGVFFILLTFQANKRRTILQLQTVSGLIFTIHYLLLGAATGAWVNLLCSIRNYVFERYHKYVWVYWVALTIFVVVGLLTWKNWTSILPLIGSVFSTTGLWQNQPRRIRLFALTMVPVWFAYNFLNGSYPGMLGDLVTFSSVAVGMYRFDIAPKLRRAPRYGHIDEYAEVAEA